MLHRLFEIASRQAGRRDEMLATMKVSPFFICLDVESMFEVSTTCDETLRNQITIKSSLKASSQILRQLRSLQTASFYWILLRGFAYENRRYFNG